MCAQTQATSALSMSNIWNLEFLYVQTLATSALNSRDEQTKFCKNNYRSIWKT